MKSSPSWIVGLGFGLVVLAVAFAPMQEIGVHYGTRNQVYLWERGYHLILNKPGPLGPSFLYRGCYAYVRIDIERYIATIALGLSLLGIAVFVASRLAKRIIQSNTGTKVKITISKRFRWLNARLGNKAVWFYLAYLWTLGSVSYLHNKAYQKRGYFDSWPEILAGAFVFFAGGLILLMAVKLINKEAAAKKMLLILCLGSAATCFLSFLGSR